MGANSFVHATTHMFITCISKIKMTIWLWFEKKKKKNRYLLPSGIGTLPYPGYDYVNLLDVRLLLPIIVASPGRLFDVVSWLDIITGWLPWDWWLSAGQRSYAGSQGCHSNMDFTCSSMYDIWHWYQRRFSWQILIFHDTFNGKIGISKLLFCKLSKFI